MALRLFASHARLEVWRYRKVMPVKGYVGENELEVARNMTVQLPPSFLDASSAERVLNKKSALVLLEIGAKSGVDQ